MSWGQMHMRNQKCIHLSWGHMPNVSWGRRLRLRCAHPYMHLLPEARKRVPAPVEYGLFARARRGHFPLFFLPRRIPRPPCDPTKFLRPVGETGRYQCGKLGGPPKMTAKSITDEQPHLHQKPGGNPATRKTTNLKKTWRNFQRRAKVGHGARWAVRNPHTTKSRASSRKRRSPTKGECSLA